MTAIIILCSFSLSLVIAITHFKRTQSKKWSIRITFFINTLLLCSATAILYWTNEEVQTFGFFHEQFYWLILFIPIVTWGVAIILGFVQRSDK